MGNYLKHKWVYYALAVLIAVIAAYESLGLLLLLVGIVLWIRYKRFSRRHQLSIIIVGITMFFYTSWILQKLEPPVSLPATVTMTDTYTINGQLLRGFVKDEQGRSVYFVYPFQTAQEKQAFEAMSLARTIFYVEGKVVAPSEPNHRFHFDMDDYLKSKNALGILEASTFRAVEAPSGVIARIYAQRYRLSTHIEEVFPPSLVAEAQALLIGEQELVDAEVNRAYQKLGITHLFAISGLHVALLSMLFFQGLLRLRVRRELATIVLIIVLPVYALLAGGAPSVWRAVSVVEFVMLTRYFNWRLPIDDALAISFIVFVLVEPGAIYQVGFQLSYLATASLIYSSPLLERAKSWWMQGFLMTFVSQLITYPLLLHHFYELSLSSFIANIVFVPLFSFIILPINIVLLLLSFLLRRISNLLFELYEPVRSLLTELILWLQHIPYQMWVAGKPNLIWIIVLYCSVFVGFMLLMKRVKLKRVLCVLLLPPLALHSSHYMQRDMLMSFINVGQGDAILIELPYRRGVYLIDTGGVLRFETEVWKQRNNVYEVGRQIVVPYLKGKGIAKIDTLILTHADADHMEGAEEIVTEIRVGDVHITPRSLEKEIMNDFIEVAKKEHLPIKEQLAGNGWQVGDVNFSYLWPIDTNYEGNNDSLVLMMQYGAFKGLFTGDLEEEGEKGLLKRNASDIANITLLKAAHHGSRTSSTESFIHTTNPQLTVFMAGQDNRYGHPHQDVLQRFHERQLPYLITGIDGTIEVRVTKTAFHVQ